MSPAIRSVISGVTMISNTSGTDFLTLFSICARIHTPITTPMIPPLPVVKIEFNGSSASYKLNCVAKVTSGAAIDIPPIIPPKASVAPNTLAALTPV